MKKRPENSPPYKILYSSTFGDMRGGGQQSLWLLLKGLDRQKFTPFLLCPEDGDLLARARGIGIETTVMPIPSLKRFSLSTIFQLIKFIKAHDIDLVHTDSPRLTLYLGLAARLCRRPLIWHVRVGDGDNPLYERFLLTLASRMIAVSKSVACRFPDSPKIKVVHNSVQLDKFRPGLYPKGRIREDLGGADRLFVGTFGQLVPKKGQETLLEAAALVLNKRRAAYKGKIKYLIVGKGDPQYSKFLQNKTKELGVADEVIFTGFRDDIPQIMSGLDIVVLYSTFIEGFSRVIIEAMASGKPVITTDLGGNPEAVIDGYNGYLLRPDNDPAPLAAAILKLANNRDKLLEMGQNSRKRVEENFDLNDNIRRIENIYLELLNR